MRKIFGALALAAAFMASAVPALAAVELETRAFTEVTTTDVNGAQETKMEPVERAKPGQKVVFVITYRNTGEEPAENLVVNNRVPNEMVYVADSAQGESALIQMSVDGNLFDELESLKVTETDGSVRAAKASDVVALRWILQGAVAPGDSGSVRYRAVLK
ncbi:DUF11 domain-containing protein [Microbulbifer hydrolyticus]|uniref:DUF11 domain-containing protein n=1 Tax=Microbulbifer hydrolyticus TaxID=48074 RepID=A0A6P1TC01_9GAMM|nr:DUF11 domain-containing protein [Microbulbifer hydrolyticus]MBB5212704.1 putative repeat protein (TIGR01451 family) [Microbulbifer hydrolyticus]QHQ40298.1 DUF11 domain-containing protein [Microbulbifer hydrolyticus]